MNNTEELLRLIKDNPDLPVVPMVDYEVVGDDCGVWLGEWGMSKITEYYLGRERVHFKDDDVEDVLCDMAGCRYSRDSHGRDIFDLSDEEWNKIFESLPWVKCIAVYITT